VTGAAGFIGYHVSQKLLESGHEVVGVDNLNDYYDVKLKQDRLRLLEHDNFKFIMQSLENIPVMQNIFATENFDYVIHLGAQAGVRYSIENPHAYINSNIIGFMNVLEGCRHYGIKHLVYASSSSVYGANTQMPFSTKHNVDHPVSLYAATKKSNELMAHTYSSLYKIPTTGLRVFTVYGPWGRPDMAPFLFTKAILDGDPINVFNHGHMKRDFTYIDDIVEGILKVADKIPTTDQSWDSSRPDPSSSYAPYKIYNIGNNTPVSLMRFIEIIEEHTGKAAIKNLLPMQPGDVHTTYADVTDLGEDVGFMPHTSLETGLERFVKWYRQYYNY